MQLNIPLPQEILSILQQFVVPIIVTIAIVVVVYIVINKILSKIRVRGIISRGIEEAIRLALFAVLTIIVVAITLSSWFQIHIVAITFTALLLLFAGFLLYSIRTYIENTISYILFASSNVVKDGELVKVNVLGNVYEGRIFMAEGGYAMIDSGNNKVYIPYSLLLRSVLIKTTQNIANFKLVIRGQSLELNKVVYEVKNILSNELKMINREGIDIKPLAVKDEEVVLKVSIEVPNPRNINECYEVLTKLLTWKLPYKFSIEFE